MPLPLLSDLRLCLRASHSHEVLERRTQGEAGRVKDRRLRTEMTTRYSEGAYQIGSVGLVLGHQQLDRTLSVLPYG